MGYLKQQWTDEGGYREFLAMAVPLILSTAAWTVQHFVDRMFLAWYSPETIAAAMPAGMLNFTIMSFFMGAASYVSAFVAQYHGANRHHRIGPALWQGLYLSLLGGLVLVFLIPLAEPIFTLAGHEPLVRQYEIEYFQILCLGGVPVIAGSALTGFFAGRGRPWPVMWVNTISTMVNILLNYALIFGHWGFPELGIRGAGLATVASAFCSLALFSILASTKANNKTFHTLKGWRPEAALFVRLLRFGLPSGAQFCLDMAGFTLFILLVGRLGINNLAATNIAFNINTLAFMPMIGSGLTVSVLVGRYLGMDRPDLAQRSVYSGFRLTFVYMSSIAAAYIFFPDIFVAPFAAQADPESFREIYRLSVILLKFVAFFCIFDTLNIIFASAIKGAGDTRFVMLVTVILSTFVLVIPTYLAVAVFGYGLMISWFIVSANVMTLGLVFYLRFRGGKWKAMRVIERSWPAGSAP